MQFSASSDGRLLGHSRVCPATCPMAAGTAAGLSRGLARKPDPGTLTGPGSCNSCTAHTGQEPKLRSFAGFAGISGASRLQPRPTSRRQGVRRRARGLGEPRRLRAAVLSGQRGKGGRARQSSLAWRFQGLGLCHSNFGRQLGHSKKGVAVSFVLQTESRCRSPALHGSLRPGPLSKWPQWSQRIFSAVFQRACLEASLSRGSATRHGTCRSTAELEKSS
mmetsp:Transcript_11365/g.18184  ORF Transcript_11365/g.18184 Transcript_11365/m.18184 type:complete len:220 (-) Transcript_11365:814-1473(-)